jgi:hypothetical protein
MDSGHLERRPGFRRSLSCWERSTAQKLRSRAPSRVVPPALDGAPLRPSSWSGGTSRVIRARRCGRWLRCAPHLSGGRALDPPPAGRGVLRGARPGLLSPAKLSSSSSPGRCWRIWRSAAGAGQSFLSWRPGCCSSSRHLSRPCRLIQRSRRSFPSEASSRAGLPRGPLFLVAVARTRRGSSTRQGASRTADDDPSAAGRHG